MELQRQNERRTIKEIDSITIETASMCNSACIMCPHHYERRKSHLMSKEEFFGIVKMFPNLKAIVFCGLYEPLIDLRLDEFLGTLSTVSPWMKKTIFTNASLLTEEKSKMLLSNKLDSITFSVHGFDRKVYETVMVGLNRDVTYNNINRFLELRGKGNSPKVTVSFVRVRQNIADLPAFREYWKDKVEVVSDYEVENWRSAVPFGRLSYTVPTGTRFCPMWDWPIVIDAFGNIVRCCYCFDRGYGKVLDGGIDNWLKKEPVSDTYPAESCKPCLGWRCGY